MIRCPVHNMPDCSPLLNGCSLVNQMHNIVDEEIARRADLSRQAGHTFTLMCTRVGRRSGVPYSEWRGIGTGWDDEGQETLMTIVYHGCESTGDKKGDVMEYTAHTDSTPSGMLPSS